MTEIYISIMFLAFCAGVIYEILTANIYQAELFKRGLIFAVIAFIIVTIFA